MKQVIQSSQKGFPHPVLSQNGMGGGGGSSFGLYKNRIPFLQQMMWSGGGSP